MTSINKDRDQVILEHIQKEDRLNHANSHLGPYETRKSSWTGSVKEWAPTSKYKVALVMLPAWGILFPPYNLAKLTGLLRSYDYSTNVYDLNIVSYHTLANMIDDDYWRGEKYFLWSIKENFESKILPLLKPLFDKIVDELVEANPKVIGFSIYNTNVFAVEYMVTELKKKLPNCCYVAGGPEISTGPGLSHLPFNYLFVGEAEETFISLLENLPNEYPEGKKLGTTDSKIKLESMPFADYSDYNLSGYQHPDGVSIETSRGCIAQCSFCAETYFWKFRSNTADRVVEEMEYQIKNHGVKRFWFVDSLVNGNLKVFERIIDLVIEKNLNIKWNGYARCDGRMTKELIQKVKDSGCTCLSYGVESGSQKVLTDMRKKVDIWEIENNLKHGSEVGLFNHVNWMIGFPTEEPIDFMHSLQLLANTRKHIGAISPGFGAGAAAASHMATDWKVYGMVSEHWLNEKTFLDSWFTEGHTNTLLHRFIRIKLVHAWLDIIKKHAKSTILNSQEFSNINDFYTFSANQSNKEYVDYENHINLNQFNESLGIANEYLSIAYALYMYFGKYEFSVISNPEKDLPAFGDWITNDYTADFNIKVEEDGSYVLNLSHTFKHAALTNKKQNQIEREHAFGDLSFTETISKTGNVKDWISSEIQTKETVHEQYRKKVITILPADE